MGLRKTVQAIAMLVSERAEFGSYSRRPLSFTQGVARQWVAEVERFARSAGASHHGETVSPAMPSPRSRASDVVVVVRHCHARFESLQLVSGIARSWQART